MINEPKYYSKFLQLRQRPDYSFTLLFESLEDADVFELVEDILIEKNERLVGIFLPDRDFSLSVSALAALTNLPRPVISDRRYVLETIFTKASEGMYDNNQVVIDKLHIIFSAKKAGLRVKFLAQMVLSDGKLSITNQIKIAHSLSDYDVANESHSIRWDELIISEKNLYLLPGLMHYFSKTDPLKSLEFLSDVTEEFAAGYADFFYFPIEKSINEFLRQKELATKGGSPMRNNLEFLFSRIQSHKILNIIKDLFFRDERLNQTINFILGLHSKTGTIFHREMRDQLLSARSETDYIIKKSALLNSQLR